MNIDQEVDIFAEELYRYLLPRRIGIHDARMKVRNPTDVNHFSDDVGKAVLMACCCYQEKFWKTFIQDYPEFLKDLRSFMTYCAGKAFAMHDEMEAMHIDVFNSLFMVGAMILELVTFCHFQNFEHFKWYAYICWTEIFKSRFKDSFFENGGWQTQRERALADAKSYDNNKHEFHIAPGKFSIPHQWLIHVDPKVIVTEPPLESVLRSLSLEADIQKTVERTNSKNTMSKESVHTINDLKKQSLQTQVKHKCTKTQLSGEPCEEANGTRMEEVLDLSTDSKLLTEAKPQKQLGAIPKTSAKTVKDCKSVSKIAISNEDILKSFMNIILCEDDEDGKYLKHVLRFNKNMQHLINDRHYFRLIKETVENSEEKPNTKKLLEEAIPIICNSTPPSEEERHLRLSCENNFFERKASSRERAQDNQQDLLESRCKIHCYFGKASRKKVSARTLNAVDKFDKSFEITKTDCKMEMSCSECELLFTSTQEIITNPNHIAATIQHINNKFGDVIKKVGNLEIEVVVKDKSHARRVTIECLDLNCSVTKRIISLKHQVSSQFSQILKVDELEDMIRNWKLTRSALIENENNFDLDELVKTIKGLILMHADLVTNADKIEEMVPKSPNFLKSLPRRGGKVQGKAVS